MPLDDALLSTLPADMNVDMDGKQVHIKDTPFLKEAKDFPSFVKGAYDAHREVGARIPVKIDATKPEERDAWRKTHLPTLYKAGVLDAPPEKPEAYGVKKPDNYPKGLTWNDDRATKFAGILHKHGAPVALAQELMALNLDDVNNSLKGLETNKEAAVTALKTEYGDKYDARSEEASRFAKLIFKSPQELQFFEDFGIANHPTFLSVMMRLAPLAMSDSSVLAGLPGGQGQGGGMTGEEVKAQLADIMNNKDNPKHKLYLMKDKKTLAEVDEMYKKAYGTGQVQL